MKASNTFGSGNSGTAYVSVSIPPVWTVVPASRSIPSGGTVLLTAAASGTPAPTFQWYLGNSADTLAPVSGATSGTFQTPVMTEDTSYWVRASNVGGNIDSSTIRIAIERPPVLNPVSAELAGTASAG